MVDMIITIYLCLTLKVEFVSSHCYLLKIIPLIALLTLYIELVANLLKECIFCVSHTCTSIEIIQMRFQNMVYVYSINVLIFFCQSF